LKNKFIENFAAVIESRKSTILWFSCIIVLCSVFYSLNKGLGFSDESWLLLHLDQSTLKFALSNWHEYVQKFGLNSVFANRLFVVTLMGSSAVVFSFGFSRLFSGIQFWGILPIALSSVFMFRFPLYVTYYVTLNAIVIFGGIGVLMLSLSAKKKMSMIVGALLSGLLLSQLFFIMITTVILVPLILVWLFIYERDRKKFLQLFLSIIVGSILGILCYFLCIESLWIFVEKTLVAKDFLPYQGNGHGLVVIARWLFSLVKYIGIEIIFPSVILLFVLRVNVPFKRLCVILLALYSIYIVGIVFFSERVMQVTFSTLVYILAFTGVYEYLCIKNKHVALLGLLFIVLPIVSNIGTNVDFRYRSVVFIMPLVLFVFKYVVDFERKPLLVLFLLFILLTAIRYSVIFPNTMSCFGQIIADQKYELDTIGSNKDLLLDEYRLQRVRRVKELVPKGSPVIFNQPELAGYIYLGELKPLALYYDYSDKGFSYLIDKKIVNLEYSELYIFEAPWEKFKETDVFWSYYRNKDTLEFEFSDFNLYKLSGCIENSSPN